MSSLGTPYRPTQPSLLSVASTVVVSAADGGEEKLSVMMTRSTDVDSDSQRLMSVSEPACRHARVHLAWSILHVHRCSSKVSIHTEGPVHPSGRVTRRGDLLNFWPVKRYPRCLGHHRCDVGTGTYGTQKILANPQLITQLSTGPATFLHGHTGINACCSCTAVDTLCKSQLPKGGQVLMPAALADSN